MPRRESQPAPLVGLIVLIAVSHLTGAESPRQSYHPEMGRPLITYYHPDVYQGNSEVTCAIQDDSGVIYFGSRDEVLEFDGISWRKTKLPDVAMVRGFARNSSGTIFVEASSDIGYLTNNPTTGTQFVSLRDRLPADRRDFSENWFVDCVGDEVFFQTFNEVFHWRKGAFEVILPPPGRTRAIHVDGNQVYFHRRGEGFYRWTEQTEELVSADPYFVNNGTFFFLPLDDGSHLVGGPRTGLQRFVDGRVSPFPGTASDYVKEHDLYGGIRLSDGRIALNTLEGGAIVMDQKGEIVHLLNDATGIENHFIQSLMEDSSGGLWLMSRGGIYRVELGPYSKIDRTQGLPTGTTGELLRHEGRLCLVTSMGLFELIPGTDRLSLAAFQRVPGLPNRLYTVKPHESGLLFTDIWRVSLKTEDDIRQLTPELGTVFLLYQSPINTNRMFIGRTSGIDAILWDGTNWTHEPMIPDVPQGVRSLQQTPDGRLWGGTVNRGVVAIDFEDPRQITISNSTRVFYPGGSAGLPNDLGWVSLIQSGEQVLVRSQRGVFRYEPGIDRFAPADSFGSRFTDGSTGVTSSVVESNDRIWVGAFSMTSDASTGRPGGYGLSQRNADGSWTWHPLSSVLSFSTYAPSAMLLETNEQGRVLWIADDDQLIRVETDRLRWRKTLPRPLVRRFTIGDGQDVFAGHGPQPTDSIPYEQNSLRFEFATPEYRPGVKVRYQTQLEGLRAEWSRSLPESQKEFGGLREGRYVFKVRAESDLGESSEVTTFAFVILPPWYRTWPAYSTYTAAALLALFGMIRWRVAHLQREQLRLETLVDQRTAELRENELQLARARDDAEAANRAKSAFLANMSHELRTPLNAILGFGQILLRDPKMDTQNRERLTILNRSGEHLLKLINEVLDLSKIESGRIEIRNQPFDFDQLVHGVADVFRPRLENKNLHFKLTLPESGLTCVLGDEQKLAQVLYNLLGNAVKFTDQGTVELNISQEDGRCRFTVRDTGIGIPADQLAGIFQPFHQVMQLSRNREGTGLGLSISRRLVELMGGQLDVQSIAGEGSTFTFEISLPDISETLTPCLGDRAHYICGYDGPRRRVLVVDDESTNRAVLRGLLEPVGFEITEAGNGPDCLREVQTSRPDLIFLDLRMEPMDGLETLRNLRALPDGQKLKVIAISASVLDFHREEAVAAGADDFIPKPFRDEHLFEAVAQALGLKWLNASSPAKLSSGDRQPVADGPPLTPELRDELLAIARRGAVQTLRERLAELRETHPAQALTFEQLDSWTRNFQMERIRAHLESMHN